jgi:hypothetical protein
VNAEDEGCQDRVLVQGCWERALAHGRFRNRCIDLGALPVGYSPLRQEGGLGLGEGGAGDPNGAGGFSEGAVMVGETTDATDDAIQKSIVSVYAK